MRGRREDMGKVSARIPDELEQDVRELIPLSGHKDLSDLIRDLLREYRDNNRHKMVKRP